MDKSVDKLSLLRNIVDSKVDYTIYDIDFEAGEDLGSVYPVLTFEVRVPYNELRAFLNSEKNHD